MAPRTNTNSHPPSSAPSRSPKALNHLSSAPEFLSPQASSGCAFFLSFLPSFPSLPLLFYLQEINPCGLPGGFTEECDSRNVYRDIYAIPVGRSHLYYQNEPLRQSKRRGHYDNGWSLLGTQGDADSEFSGSQVHNLFNTRVDQKFQRHTNRCLLKKCMSYTVLYNIKCIIIQI